MASVRDKEITESKDASSFFSSISSSVSGLFYSEPTVVPVVEIKQEVTKTKELIKDLKQLASKIAPITSSDIKDLSEESLLITCQNIFSSDCALLMGKAIFDNYPVIHGEKPTFASTSSLFGYKTKQMENFLASVAIGDTKLIRKDLLPKHIFNALCVLKKIHSDIVNDGLLTSDRGETREVIEALLAIYQMPIDDKEFDNVKKILGKALENLAIFACMGGSIPKATMDVMNKYQKR